MKIHNFSAGPSILPNSVLKKASKSVIELNDIGLSLLEISHRSQEFTSIMEEAKNLTKEILNISNEYEILFLQGGASLQFYMTSLNFSRQNGVSGYIDTGTWSSKAIKEANKTGATVTVASSKDKNYNYIPKTITLENPLDYLHFTSNNTIYGTQFHSYQYILNQLQGTPLICDMSSDIFSKKININDFDLIYAGAQKNIGPAGATLIIIKKEAVKNKITLPTYLNYQTHIEKQSMFNTPPVFSIYVCMLTLRWIKQIGGIEAIAEMNQKKAELIYAEIDRNPLFYGLTELEDRSMMNATFGLKQDVLKDTFDTLCNQAGISGINGHRSVGGYRASMYNALNIESVNVLVDTMKKLEKIA